MLQIGEKNPQLFGKYKDFFEVYARDYIIRKRGVEGGDTYRKSKIKTPSIQYTFWTEFLVREIQGFRRITEKLSFGFCDVLLLRTIILNLNFCYKLKERVLNIKLLFYFILLNAVHRNSICVRIDRQQDIYYF